MRPENLILVLTLLVAGCVRAPAPHRAPVENDRAIVFPHFFEHSAVEVGGGGGPYELEGVVLRAILIVANDFLPANADQNICWNRQEAHRYRVIRQGDIIFVRIDEDLEPCGLQYISLHAGASYAVSTDGRILRRIFDSEPESYSPPTAPLDASSPRAQQEPEPLPLEQQDGGTVHVPPEPPAPPTSPDGGTAP